MVSWATTYSPKVTTLITVSLFSISPMLNDSCHVLLNIKTTCVSLIRYRQDRYQLQINLYLCPYG